jgi:hypothetical protein
VSVKLAEVELHHVVDALDRIRRNLRGSAVEKDAERLLELAKDTLALVKKENPK